MIYLYQNCPHTHTCRAVRQDYVCTHSTSIKTRRKKNYLFFNIQKILLHNWERRKVRKKFNESLFVAIIGMLSHKSYRKLHIKQDKLNDCGKIGEKKILLRLTSEFLYSLFSLLEISVGCNDCGSFLSEPYGYSTSNSTTGACKNIKNLLNLLKFSIFLPNFGKLSYFNLVS